MSAIRDSKADGLDDICEACGGTGSDMTKRPLRSFLKLNPQRCPACGGTGRKLPKKEAAS